MLHDLLGGWLRLSECPDEAEEKTDPAPAKHSIHYGNADCIRMLCESGDPSREHVNRDSKKEDKANNPF